MEDESVVFHIKGIVMECVQIGVVLEIFLSGFQSNCNHGIDV